MDLPSFSAVFRTVLAENGISVPLTERQTRQFYDLMERLLTINRTMNLTAIRDEAGVMLYHFADSLTLLPFLPAAGTVLDVGCGGGFPSLPLAICRPDLTFAGLDSTEKKVRYVAETAAVLGLSNYQTLTGRAEELAHEALRERFDAVTARAVADLPVLAELCLPFLAVGGSFLAMKGARGKAELTAAGGAVETLGGAVTAAHALSLRGENGEPETRFIVEIKKARPTSAAYPRPYAKIQKKPL